MPQLKTSKRARPATDVRAILRRSANGQEARYGSKLVNWLKDPWWPPSFLHRPFNWRLPIIIGVICAVAVAYLSGGGNSVWVLLFSLNAVIYIGIPFALVLVVFWKSDSDRGRLIACDLASCLVVLVFLIPGNIVGKVYASRQIERAKSAGSGIAERIEAYQSQSGRLPLSLEELRLSQPLPSSPFPVQYRIAPSGGVYELKISDPTCLFDCYWVYHPSRKEWFFVGG